MNADTYVLAGAVGLLAGLIVGNLLPLFLMDWLAARERRRLMAVWPPDEPPLPIYPNPAGY